MNAENSRKLEKAFPNIYPPIDPLSPADCEWSFQFDIGDGWFEILWELSEKLEAEIVRLIKEGRPSEDLPSVQQVKEKYGELCFYASGTDKMQSDITIAQEKSLTICELCGKPGKPNWNDDEEMPGWMMVRCEEHENITPARWNKMQMDKEYEKFYTEETIEKMLEKAKHSFDAIDFTMGVIICISHKCPRKSECFRYVLCDRLLKNKIYGHTATIFEPKDCNHFIELQK